MADRLDVIIFGATGYSGQITVEKAANLLENYTWGIAGRNRNKLNETLKNIGKKTGINLNNIPIILADVNDSDSLNKMTNKAKVIVNCCGPYRLYGEAVVKACINAGTHHVDISGEFQYIEMMALKYNEEAKYKQIYIISTCGFDCIPTDMGVVFFENNFNGIVNSIESYLQLDNERNPSIFDASAHYGTWASIVHSIGNNYEISEIRRKLFPKKLPEMTPKLEKKIIHTSPSGKWSVIFPAVDRFVVERSQRFDLEMQNKRPIQYMHYISFSSIIIIIGLLFFGVILTILSKFTLGRKILLNYPRLFTLGQISHDGPSESKRKQSKCILTFYGNGWESVQNLNIVSGTMDQSFTTPPTKTLVTRVTAYDPGYGATAVSLLLSATTILTESENIPIAGGVLTPASAFRKTNYINKLIKNGYKFEVVSRKRPETN